MRRIWGLLLLAATVAGCAIDDSGPIRSVWRPEPPKTTYSDVVYVTDREADASFPGGFATRWGGQPSCGTAETVIPPATGADGKLEYGYVAKAHPTVCATAKGKLGGAIALIEAQAAARHCRSVFVFVHGFHTGFDGAVLRAAQIAKDAQTACAVAAFSWSAEINIDRYVSDIEHSDYAQPLLEEFLRELSESGLRVTLLGHSLGGRLSLMTLSAMNQSRQPPRPGFISELVLAAPDIGAEAKNNDFLKLMAGAVPLAKRTTVYVSSYDSVLEISRREHGGVPRLGSSKDISFTPSAEDREVDIIDASNAAADRLDHSYYAMSPETLKDMTLVLNGVSLKTRALGSEGWKPTIQCGTSPCKPRLSGEDERMPRFVTRFILHVLPVIPLVR
ncbi:esterase/lipase superfamily enzyme [Rhizomicrobium palustre]|uniref:Esterase/lipase superfamily enzyme n=1 Tax=Rhizomicrobium palustre TaxID=189966 RepID=A0A846N0N6_9PROT|nr:alpha/beta fold hydrolase [Rhizomicrobium palustre]NIK89059.1 esterase/lipase superfamily enzyme [Rhizomicrobium palustre]